MADGYQHYLQQPFGNAILAPIGSANSIVSGKALYKSILNHLTAESPPRTTNPAAAQGSPGELAQGMYGQNHQGQSSRLNARPGPQPMLSYFQPQQQQGSHPHQALTGHHHQVQPDHSGRGTGANLMGHPSAYSSGVLTNASPFTSNLSNGHGTTPRVVQAQQITEHWAEQLKLHKDNQHAHSAMVDQHQTHFYARLKANDNTRLQVSAPAGSADVEAENEEDRRRPYEIDKPRQNWHNLDMSGQGLRSLSTPLFMNYTFLQELYIPSNKITHLPAGIGQLRKLRLLNASNNLIQELPGEIGMCTGLQKLLLFDNQIRELPYELGSLYQLNMLGIEGNPINQERRKELMERGTKSLVTTLRESAPIPFPPNPRKIVVVQEDVAPTLERVKMLSWNILGDKYATPQTYGYTPTGALAWEHRKERILEELRDADADMLCLQEITGDMFSNFLSPELVRKGYKGVHWPRPKAKTMAEKEAATVDGCAVFYKAAKWILLEKHLVDYCGTAINRPDMKNHHDIFNRVMPKDNIGIICLFESRRTGARLIVANTHLAWEPHLKDVKLVQTAILMETLTKLSERWARHPPSKDKRIVQVPLLADGEEMPEETEPAPSQEYRSGTEIPLVVCGDYNSTPESGVYEFITAGHVPPNHGDFQKHQYGLFTREGVAHPFSMRSAYAQLNGTPDELTFTNWVPDFQGVIDWIWYGNNTLEVVELLGPPDKEYMKRIPGFPTWHFPADHIQVMAELVIKARKDKKMVEPDFASGTGADRRS